MSWNGCLRAWTGEELGFCERGWWSLGSWVFLFVPRWDLRVVILGLGV